MSFSLTTQQFEARTKDITRRFGWDFLEPGDVVMGVEKGMGLKKGEKVRKLHPIRIKSKTVEPMAAIRTYPSDECAREGFPEMSPDEFIDMLRKHSGKPETAIVNRFEFEHLEESEG